MYKTILFDLDGTLSASAPGVCNSIKYSLKKNNYVDYDETVLGTFIGPPLYESYARAFGFSKEEIEKYIADYQEYYSDKGIYETSLYPGIRELLQALKDAGCSIVLATSKPVRYSGSVLDYLGISEYFNRTVSASNDEKSGKKSMIIKQALEEIAPENLNDIVMVGDHPDDINGANENGIDSIAVLYGYGSKEEIIKAHPTFIVEKVEEILPIIQKNRATIE